MKHIRRLNSEDLASVVEILDSTAQDIRPFETSPLSLTTKSHFMLGLSGDPEYPTFESYGLFEDGQLDCFNRVKRINDYSYWLFFLNAISRKTTREYYSTDPKFDNNHTLLLNKTLMFMEERGFKVAYINIPSQSFNHWKQNNLCRLNDEYYRLTVLETVPAGCLPSINMHQTQFTNQLTGERVLRDVDYQIVHCNYQL